MAEYTLSEFLGRIRDQVLDEEKAFNEYKDLSAYAHRLGLHGMADMLDNISLDEHKHRVVLRNMVEELSSKVPSEECKEVGHRPFPSTVKDWWKLGDDIIAKSPHHKAVVDEAIASIVKGDEYSEGSKRLLTSLAHSLGIT